MGRLAKILAAVLVLALAGAAGFWLYSARGAGGRGEADIRGRQFALMIENYSTPVADLSVSSMKRSRAHFGKVVSTRCRIAEFNDPEGKQGFIRDVVRVDSFPFLFVVHKIPDGAKWGRYFNLIAGKRKELVMHGLLIDANGKSYFVPQRIFSPDNKSVDVLLQEAELRKAERQKNRARGGIN